MDPMRAQPTEDGGFPVVLRVYDLSRGMAATFSQALVGKHFDGIWHTGVYVFGNEYYFGGGIQMDPIDFVEARVGRPVQTLLLGYTYIPKEMFHEYLRGISHMYTVQTYNLLTHNCNNFSSDISKFLTGTEIPAYILNLPQEALSTPLGSVIKNLMDGFQTNMQHNGAIPGFGGNASAFPPTQPASTTSAITQTQERPATSPSQSPANGNPKQAWDETGQSSQTLTASPSPKGVHSPQLSQKPPSDGIDATQETPLSFLLSDQGTATASVSKLISLSANMTGLAKLTDSDVEVLTGLSEGKSNNIDAARVIVKMIRLWPLPNLVHVLLCAKTVALNEQTHSVFCEEKDTIDRIVKVVSTFDETVTKFVRIMALCFITNLFAKKTGAEYLMKEELIEPILDAVIRGMYHSDVNIRTTCSALLQNIIVAVVSTKPSREETLTQITCALSDRITAETDEAITTRIMEHLCYLKTRDTQQAALMAQLQIPIPSHLSTHASPRIARLASILAAD